MPTRPWMLFAAIVLGAHAVEATPPYGDPNQPYDRLPGTLETYHVKWAKPLASGRLNVLFIIPYCNSREVVETAQRLDLRYTVIMNAGFAVWDKGYYEGPTATPLKGVEAEVVLRDITRERLSLGHRYDAIVIAKVSWPVIPDYARELILKHVERGTGLVYVCPNRLKHGLRSSQEAGGTGPQFTKLFETDADPSVAERILQSLPIDVMPLHVLKSHGECRPLPGVGTRWYAQSALCLTNSRLGQGRVLALDYHDEVMANRSGNSLTSYVRGPHNHPTFGHDFAVMYDYAFALLAKGILWAAGREPAVSAAVEVQAPPTTLTAPVDAKIKRHSWAYKTPATVVAREDLGRAKLVLGAAGATETHKVELAYTIRDLAGTVQHHGRAPATVGPDKGAHEAIPLPMLARGTYVTDLRVLDHTERVLDFASRSFRVETAFQVATVKADKDAYQAGETITGLATFSVPLDEEQRAAVRAVDTWGRTVARSEVVIAPDRGSGAFRMPVRRPLSELWDVHVDVSDSRGVVDSAKTWVGLPNRTFDDYLFMLIFAPTPDVCNWKGNLYGSLMRRYGINSAFTYLIYSNFRQYEINARHNLRSVSYAAHWGEIGEPSDRKFDTRKIRYDREIGELIPMCRRIAETGKPIDPKEFPYKLEFGHFSLGAELINSKFAEYQRAARFGSPFYVITGENYLFGEWNGMGNTGFGKTSTRRFQAWCRQQYKNDLAALNREWNTKLTDWAEVKGILLQDAVERDQMPRWVDFRYFMRSRVWSEFFIAYTAMMRRAIPGARTGRCGHDHHDFSRYRDHMTCSKVYIGQKANSEWRDALTPELLQSFSGDRSFLLAPQSMIRWSYDIEKPVRRERWPWICLFLGLNGFDWERGCGAETLGGEHCFTPCYSEPLPYFLDVSREVRFLQRGIGKLTIAAKPHRSEVAVLWAPNNHYISRLDPFQANGFSGTWMHNVSVIGGAHSDALALLNSLRIRPTFVSPEDLLDGGLQKRGFRALVLPYSKGVSHTEAEAIRRFAAEGGLVIADNTPGVYTEHGRKLGAERRLKDLFPHLDRKHLAHVGKGHAAYVPGEINGYTGRMEKCDYTGADSVGALLKQYADQTPPVELIDARGMPRRDTLMPVFRNGSTTLVGLLRAGPSEGQEPEATTVRLDRKYHVWDVRTRSYCGNTAELAVRLDLRPQYYALLPVSLHHLTIRGDGAGVEPGRDLDLVGRVVFGDGAANEAAKLAQVVHVRVYDPVGRELEHFRSNVLFEGGSFKVILPISYSEPPGRYSVEAEHAITGMKAKTWFDVLTKEGDER